MGGASHIKMEAKEEKKYENFLESKHEEINSKLSFNNKNKPGHYLFHSEEQCLAVNSPNSYTYNIFFFVGKRFMLAIT